MIDRRSFIGSLAGGLFAAPLAAEAQQAGKMPRLGYLSLFSASNPYPPSEAFWQGMRDLGWVDGQNIAIERRFAECNAQRLPALAAELVQVKVDVIVAGATPAPDEAKRVTSTIPIVFTSHPDPVGSGLAASLAKPGGNVTGLSVLSRDLVGKQLQLLKEAIPGISSVAVLWNPTVTTHTLVLREAEIAARSLKVKLHVLEARNPIDFRSAFSAMAKDRAGALIVLSSTMLFAERSRIAELAAQIGLPAMYMFREYAEAGGFIAYGPNLRENWRRAATFVDKILKGAKPGDLPIEQPSKFELVINLRTAKELGLTIPSSLLQRADELIQ